MKRKILLQENPEENADESDSANTGVGNQEHLAEGHKTLEDRPG